MPNVFKILKRRSSIGGAPWQLDRRATVIFTAASMVLFGTAGGCCYFAFRLHLVGGITESTIPSFLLPLTLLMSAGALTLTLVFMNAESLRLKTALQSLQQRERHLASIADNLPGILAHIDCDLRYKFANAACAKRWGRTPEQLIGLSIRDVLDEGAFEKSRPYIQRVLSGEKVTFDNQFLTADGTTQFGTVTLVPELDPKGDICGYYTLVIDTTESKNAKDALWKSETRLRTIIETEPECVMVIGADGVLIEMNAAGLALLEANLLAEVQQHPFIEYISPEYRSAFEKLYCGTMRGECCSIAFEVIGLKGQRRWVETHAAPLRDATGEIRDMLGVTRDITANRRAEENLRRSEHFARTALNALSLHIAVLDESGKILSVNNAWRQFARANAAQVTSVSEGTNYLEVCESDPRDLSAIRFAAGIRGVIKGTMPEFQFEYACHSPTQERWFIGRAARFPIEDLNRIIISHAEITERKLAEEELRRIFNLSLDIIVSAGYGGGFKSFNPSFERALGYPAEELKTKSFLDIVHADDFETAAGEVEKVIDGSPTSFTVRCLAKDGSTRLLEWNLAPMPGARLMFGMARDISERKKLEEKMLQAQKMDAIGQLAGGIAHDFNNQLNVILGYANLLAGAMQDTNLKRFATSIVSCAERSADLTRELLAFSRKRQYQNTQVPVHDLIRETVEMLLHSIDKRIEIKMHLMAGASTISGDPAQIQNAILNLGINSRDAMPDGGELCFETKNVFVDATLVEKYLHEIACGDFIQITVRDTGCGMNDEVKAHLFEPFYTTKPIGKGTGMGLASVYGTVKSHKGAIQVFSEIGRGTAFHILLPMERPRRSSMPPVSAAPTDKLSSITDLRILIVDDEDSMRALFKDILLPAGNELLYAENGRVGLDVFSEQWPDIDVVIFDMMMPEMNGAEMFRGIKKINPHVKTVLASGFSVNSEVETLVDEGVSALLQKPFSRRELLQAIAAALDSPSPVPVA